jgi:hypothetical protein
LDFLGFSWILSFESRHFNGLRGLFAGGIFLGPFPWGFTAPGREPTVEAVRNGSIVHAGELNLVVGCEITVARSVNSVGQAKKSPA